MAKLKKNKVLFEKGKTPKSFVYIVSGSVTDSRVVHKAGSFIGVVPYLLDIPIISAYKSLDSVEYNEYTSITEVPQELIQNLLKEISKNYISLAYFNLAKKFPNPEEIFLCSENKKEEEYEEDDDEVIDFIENFDFLMSGMEDVDVPEKFDDFVALLKMHLQEFSIMKFVNLLKAALNKFDDEQWEAMLLELFDRIVTMEDRALMLYLVYIAAMRFKNINTINVFLKKNWEVLRFYGKNNWIDYAMGYMNNKLFLSEVNK